jgi:eukaryotic-like serine/threonine-protein kinase
VPGFPAEPSGGLLLGRFELKQTVLIDSFGEVKSAIDRKTNKEVSLRALGSPELAQAARQQLKALADFSHPNVVREYGVMSAGSGPTLLVQGPLHGHHLADFVAKHVQSGKPISLRGSYNVVAHVCNALGAIHARGPHAAVRPTAVWLHDDGKVQIADLALSRAALATGSALRVSPAEAAFLAPELKAGQAPTLSSDIFGLGALLYVLLTGRSPMDAFVLPSQVHPEASPAIDAELIRALSPDPGARHANPDAFRSALLTFVGGAAEASADDFGIDIEVEVNLASLAPGPRTGTHNALAVPQAGRVPRESGDHPEVGARISLNEPFRASMIEIDASEAEAARNRTSLGEIDLKDVLAKITEDDSPRWMMVKNGMDHGPFSGRQLVNMIVQGEALKSHELMNTDTGRRGALSEFQEFQEFLAQYELRKSEADKASALAHVETKEKHSARYKILFGAVGLGVIGLCAGIYALSLSGAGSSGKGDAALDMYRRGQVAIEGSAGILPTPRGGGGGGRRAGGGGGGGPAGMSYEDAMMQAIDIGSAHSGGEQTLKAATVAGVMNQHLNQFFRACVRGSVGQVKIDIAIAGSGQVMGVSVGAGDAGFQRCVAEQVRKIHFPGFSAPRMGARYSFGT